MSSSEKKRGEATVASKSPPFSTPALAAENHHKNGDDNGHGDDAPVTALKESMPSSTVAHDQSHDMDGFGQFLDELRDFRNAVNEKGDSFESYLDIMRMQLAFWKENEAFQDYNVVDEDAPLKKSVSSDTEADIDGFGQYLNELREFRNTVNEKGDIFKSYLDIMRMQLGFWKHNETCQDCNVEDEEDRLKESVSSVTGALDQSHDVDGFEQYVDELREFRNTLNERDDSFKSYLDIMRGQLEFWKQNENFQQCKAGDEDSSDHGSSHQSNFESNKPIFPENGESGIDRNKKPLLSANGVPLMSDKGVPLIAANDYYSVFKKQDNTSSTLDETLGENAPLGESAPHGGVKRRRNTSSVSSEEAPCGGVKRRRNTSSVLSEATPRRKVSSKTAKFLAKRLTKRHAKRQDKSQAKQQAKAYRQAKANRRAKANRQAKAKCQINCQANRRRNTNSLASEAE